MRDIGKNLKRLRLAKGLTQDELAELLFVTRQTVSNYENGRSRPDIETLMTIAEILETDVNTVLYGEKTKSENLRSEKRNLFTVFLLTTVLLLTCYIVNNLSKIDGYPFRGDWVFILEYYVNYVFLPVIFFCSGWILPRGLELFGHIKAPNLSWGKYVRYCLLLFVLCCFACMLPSMIGWFCQLLPVLRGTPWLRIPILSHFEYEVLLLNRNAPWIYMVFGILLWLFGFPQKSVSKVE